MAFLKTLPILLIFGNLNPQTCFLQYKVCVYFCWLIIRCDVIDMIRLLVSEKCHFEKKLKHFVKVLVMLLVCCYPTNS